MHDLVLFNVNIQQVSFFHYLSNVSFDFVNILTPDDSILYVEGGVQSAQIPASFYNVDSTNNVFN